MNKMGTMFMPHAFRFSKLRVGQVPNICFVALETLRSSRSLNDRARCAGGLHNLSSEAFSGIRQVAARPHRLDTRRWE